MAGKILVLVISCMAIAAGWKYVWTARRMRTFETTRGAVTGREIERFHRREGRFGKGGGHRPIVTYVYSVGGVTYTSDRWSYVTAGFKRHVVQQLLDALPDEVDVHYNPAKPQEAYLHTNTPGWGYVMAAGGVIGVLVSAALLFA
jgi:Protein of unknown function (DUF3592)